MKTDYPPEIPFDEVIDALLDETTPLNPRYLYRLSDLPPEDLDLLTQAWERVPAWRRRALMEDLEVLNDSDTRLSFEGVGRLALTDKDPQARRLAIRVLDEYELADLLPTLLKLLGTDDDPGVRAAAATALGRFIYLGEIEELPEKKLHIVEEALLRSVNGSDETLVRRRALEALGYSGRGEIPALIEAAYKARDEDWLITALFAMGRSANTEWNPHVLTCLDHASPEVRFEAARAAGELRIKESVPSLLAMLDDSDHDVSSAAIWSLSEIGGPGVAERLESLLETAEDDDDIDLLEDALENLAFNEDFEIVSMFDFDEDQPLDDDEDLDDIDDETDDEDEHC
jgi:HEAT repeat protein